MKKTITQKVAEGFLKGASNIQGIIQSSIFEGLSSHLTKNKNKNNN